MKIDVITRRTIASRLFAYGVLLLAVISYVLASPKWPIPLFAWIAPVSILFFTRIAFVKGKWIGMFAALLVSQTLASMDVAPFPFPVLIIIALIQSSLRLLLLFLDKKINSKFPSLISSFFFPAASVTLEYFNVRFGGGAWHSIANSQYPFSWLIQISSVTGIWGISFMIYWFASMAVWCIEKRKDFHSVRKAFIVYASVFLLVLTFGALRYYSGEAPNQKKVKVAGISVSNLFFLEALYKDYRGKIVQIDPRTSISSPSLKEIMQAEVPFIETADTISFKNGYNAFKKINDSLFSLSQQATDKGAKIISWSEANALAFPFSEGQLLQRGKDFAFVNRVYLMMAIAVIHPGAISPGRKFLENKAILIGPDGKVLNTFHKNNPVPIAESSVPGDGNIPVVESPYGRIATSICYDADFPIQMRQLSHKKADVLILPSGDWYAIAPIHTYMSLFRGIENGCSVIRQVSGGLSVASDFRGKIHAKMNFYETGTKMWVAEIPLGHVTTVYSIIGDLLAYLCIVFTILGIVSLIVRKLSIGSGKRDVFQMG